MDSQFEKVTYDIINKFLEQLSDRCIIPHDKLWGIWKDMFNFPTKKEKRVVKKVKTPPKEEKKEEQVEKVKEEQVEKVEKKEEVQVEKVEQVENVKEEVQEEEVKEEKQEVQVEDVKEKVKEKVKKEAKEKSPKKESETCVFIITRGERAGKECGKPISKKMKSDKYCVVHSK
jgi:preprotein translocase subunit SecF